MLPAMMQSTRLALILGLSGALGLAAACSSQSGPTRPSGQSAGGGSNTGGVSTGNGGTSPINPAAGTGNTVDVMPGTGESDAGACQQAEVKFEPKIPTVYMLVDRSGSMFDCISTTGTQEPSCMTPDDTAWVKLKSAALNVIEGLQSEVRFGFAAFTGTNPMHGGKCPMIDQVEPALNNQAAIKTLYDSLPFQPNTNESGKKFETPARQALDMIGAKLLADTTPGDKYVLFVTDGQPDYCDDANSLCAPDSVIAGLQNLYAQGITTLVMGLQSKVNDLPPGILQAFANAGRGEPTVAPLRNAMGTTFDFYDQCLGVAGWKADLMASGKTSERGVTLGTYSETAGPSKPSTPSSSDQDMIVEELRRALQTVKTCDFDLQGKIKVDLAKAGDGKVAIDGDQVGYDASKANGWHMETETQLKLDGAACEKWRSTGKQINFDFPCDIIVVVK